MPCLEESRDLLHETFLTKQPPVLNKLNITHGLVVARRILRSSLNFGSGLADMLYLIYRGKSLYVGRILKASL